MEALNQIKVGIITIGMIIVFATIGWMHIEGWDLFTSLYVSIITVSTVGYGDVTPQTFLGKLLSLIIVVSGVGAVAYTFSGIARFFIEGQFKRIIRLKKMQNRLKKLSDHYIICGFGKFGKVVAKKFKDAGVPFVVIDEDQQTVDEILEKDPNLIYVVGDATSDDVLYKAGIERAKGLITVVDSDAENVFITLSAKRLNPNIYTVAKAENKNTVDKLLKAGADRVVSPYDIGGSRIAEMSLKPEVFDFVSSLMDISQDMEIGKFQIPKTSGIVGKTLYESKIRPKTGATILAIKKGNELLVNPGPDTVLDRDNIICAFGTKKQLEELKKILDDK